jgi:hypothetical protein
MVTYACEVCGMDAEIEEIEARRDEAFNLGFCRECSAGGGQVHNQPGDGAVTIEMPF